MWNDVVSFLWILFCVLVGIPVGLFLLVAVFYVAGMAWTLGTVRCLKNLEKEEKDNNVK